MEYAYTVARDDGSLLRGTADAESSRDAVAALRAQGFLVLDVHKRPRQRALTRLWQAAGARASLLERALLARHLALMLRAGLTIDRALQVLVAQTSRRGLLRVLTEVHAAVRRGEALSVACGRFPRVFPPLFVSLLRWGEAGGSLPESLERLAAQFEKDLSLRSKVRGALLYPAIVVGAALVVGIGMSTFVLPRLLTLFESFKVALPLPTKIVLVVGRGVTTHGVRVLGVALLLGVAIFFLSRLSSVRPRVHRAVLFLPLFGRLVRDVNLARFERILGSLVRSGLPVVDALAITGDAMTNLRYQEVLRDVRAQAQRGLPMAGILAKTPRLFPPIHSQMVAVGEETGRLHEVLLYLADFTEAEVDATTKNLATTLEPVLLVFVGVLVGGIALAVILPIYQLTASFSR